MKRRVLVEKRQLQLFTKRFFPAGNYTWTVPPGCTEIDAFLVGGGAGGGAVSSGSGSGYTKTYKSSNVSSGSYNSWVKDGDSIKVFPGEKISIKVGAGGVGALGGNITSAEWYNNSPKAMGANGEDSSIAAIFGVYTAGGGTANKILDPTNPVEMSGSGGCACSLPGGYQATSDAVASDGRQPLRQGISAGISQAHTTRDFGEIEYLPNAGGTSGRAGSWGRTSPYLSVGYTEGKGEDGGVGSSSYYDRSFGGAGYGGAGGTGGGKDLSVSTQGRGGRGGDGTVVIRYWAYSAE